MSITIDGREYAYIDDALYIGGRRVMEARTLGGELLYPRAGDGAKAVYKLSGKVTTEITRGASGALGHRYSYSYRLKTSAVCSFTFDAEPFSYTSYGQQYTTKYVIPKTDARIGNEGGWLYIYNAALPNSGSPHVSVAMKVKVENYHTTDSNPRSGSSEEEQFFFGKMTEDGFEFTAETDDWIEIVSVPGLYKHVMNPIEVNDLCETLVYPYGESRGKGIALNGIVAQLRYPTTSSYYAWIDAGAVFTELLYTNTENRQVGDGNWHSVVIGKASEESMIATLDDLDLSDW